MSQNRSRNRVLVFIIFLLLLTNILMLGYFLYFCKKPPKKSAGKGKDNFSVVLQREVGFDESQVKKFNELQKTHWADAKAGMEHIVRIKNNIFDLTKNPHTPDSVINRLADSIGMLQKQVEINAFKHVVGTRRICRPEQQPAYDSLMKRIINRGRTGKGAPSPERK